MTIRAVLVFSIFAFSISCSDIVQAQWGLLGKLGKLGSKVDAPDLKKIDLPTAHKGLDAKQIQANANGDWDIVLDDGRRVSIQDAGSHGVDLSTTALFIRSLDIPNDLSVIKKIPPQVPVYISGAGKQVFELSRVADALQLKYKNVVAPVDTPLNINNIIYQFGRTVLRGKTRYLNLTDNTNDVLPKIRPGVNPSVESVSSRSLIKSLQEIRQQNIVLSGTTKNGRLIAKDSSDGISIDELNKIADQNELTLVVLETSKPKKLLQSLVKKDIRESNDSAYVGDSTADFFSQLASQNGGDAISLSFTKSGSSQVGMQLKKSATESLGPTEALPNDKNLLAGQAIVALVKGASLVRPALDPVDQPMTFGWGVASALSLLFGLLYLKTNERVWSFIWRAPTKEQRQTSLQKRMVYWLNRLFLFCVFLPAFGLIIAISAVFFRVLRYIFRIPIAIVFWVLRLFGLKKKAPKKAPKKDKSTVDELALEREGIADTIKNAFVYTGSESGESGRYQVMQSDLGYPDTLASAAQKFHLTSISELKELANKSDPEACNELGRRYAHGEKLSQSDEQAFDWFNKAASQQHAIGQHNLAVMYRYGQGVEQSWSNARKYYELSADQNCADALNDLGWMHRMGRGVSHDNQQAVVFFKRAVKLGSGMAYYNLGNMTRDGLATEQSDKEALRLYNLGAKAGVAPAINMAGSMYQWGDGIERDSSKAVELYRHGSELGSSSAMDHLAQCYEYGHGLEKDYDKAMHWYQKSAEAGYPLAQFNLGCSYHNGRITEKNFERAIYWYQLACEWGDPNAMTNLGNMYKKGQGVEKNIERALELYREAASEGNAVAMYVLGLMYEAGDDIEKDVNKAFEWHQRAAFAGHFYAAYKVADMYHDGVGTEKDPEQARGWYLSAASRGHTFSQYLIGFFYKWGDGVVENLPLAAKWYEKAASNGNAGAAYNLAVMLNDGDGIPVDYERAYAFFEQAAAGDKTDSYNYIANMYFYGNGVKKSYAAAIEWLNKGADAGDLIAINNLGVVHRDGKGVTRSYEKAVEYFTKAASQGAKEAMNNLAYMYEKGKGVNKDKTSGEYWRQRANSSD